MYIFVEISDSVEMVLHSYIFFLFTASPVAYGSSGPGVELRLKLRPMLQPQQYWIWAVSVTYAAGCSNAKSLTHWARPGVEPTFSQRKDQVSNLLSHNGNSCLFVWFRLLTDWMRQSCITEANLLYLVQWSNAYFLQKRLPDTPA